MPRVVISEELREEVIKELEGEIPEMPGIIEELRAKLLDEVGKVVGDILVKTVESIVAIILKAVEAFGVVVAVLDVHRELGKRIVLYNERITLLSPTEAIIAYLRKHITEGELKEELAHQGYSDEKISTLVDITRQILSPSDIVNAYIRKRINYEEALSELERLGFTEYHAQVILDSSYHLLTPDEYISLWHRGVIADEELDFNLSRLGYSEYEIENLKTLSYYIPPPPDLIRMAVREVFSPETVERFGQFEDFPEKFAEWAEKLGMSRTWAENYWAAHWDLPSATMGFEMFHRGIINKEDLELLLKALDVMPFWREKLIQLAYTPLTRVDIRRMFQLGVLDRNEVYRAYLDIGYSPENAERMTQFTEVLVAEGERDLSKSELMTAFEAGMLHETEVREYLKALKYSDEQINILLALSEYKREKKIKDAKIKGLKAKFMANLIDEDELLRGLAALALSSIEIDTYIETFVAERLSKAEELSLKDLRDALKLKIISIDVFRMKLKRKGYIDEDIDIMIKLVQKGVT